MWKCGMIPASLESFILWNELNTYPSRYIYGRVNVLKDSYTLIRKPVPGDFDWVQFSGRSRQGFLRPGHLSWQQKGEYEWIRQEEEEESSSRRTNVLCSRPLLLGEVWQISWYHWHLERRSVMWLEQLFQIWGAVTKYFKYCRMKCVCASVCVIVFVCDGGSKDSASQINEVIH